MKFNIDDYKGNYVMHCKTKEEAESFCKYLHSLGKKWSNRDNYFPHTNWENYGTCTCYDFNRNEFSGISFYKAKNYTILEWEDFMGKKEFTKADLKSGDIVIFRNHDAGVVFLEQNAIIFKGFGEYIELSDYDTKLCDILSEEWDIVKVHRPNSPDGLIHDQWYKAPVVWEREEAVEMTLEEVCKALGKEIKIVKSK